MGLEIGFFIGAVVLGAALAFGILQNRRRNRANDPVTEAAVREQYRDIDAYADGKEAELRTKVRPS
ncbi:hypothetical protein RHAL1_03909 [Beijerinckiaceae bacterium RH AL1]|nr:hypothetical protein [Beijerinckiaceae bacterium]VVB49575.1 hypothetical protein RHCH11_RHCH11_03833 [Beijerinckiaceae bacterium RH CH11]VVB49655.1 hypothetical protein RHAL8_03829 [Beijerinckiaceae bacterium RH AL8]VVC56973.1 hypothetical protein RHAL1_03909 [Beijerinckiaceae bacterium RH AL1]